MPDFEKDPTGFTMKNTELASSMKYKTPMQKNYGKGMKFNAELRAADLPEGKFKDAVDASGAKYASPAKDNEMTAEQKQAASLAAAEKTEGITVSAKKYTDVTNEYKTKGNQKTRDHIASGGKVEKGADGSLRLTNASKPSN